MKTIAERAREYAENEDLVQGTDGFDYCLRDYIKGATEQKVIDIDKACEWLESYCCEIGCKYDCNFDDIMVDGPKRLRKAMEE